MDLCESFPLSHVTTIDHISYDEDGQVKYHYVIVEYVGLRSEASDQERPGDDAASIAWAGLDNIESLNILDMVAHKRVLEQAIQKYKQRL